MLKVIHIDTKDLFNVYDVFLPLNSNCPLFLLYDKRNKDFIWYYSDNYEPNCKELFKITKKSDVDKRNKHNVFAVHRKRSSLIPPCYLIYTNQSWEWVYGDEYEIISPDEIK